MVILCNTPLALPEYIQNDLQPASLVLSDFQKWAIKAIMEGDNVLITAHTGSGKTLPAEFAIQYFAKQKKKVIYASPIKALSNQKLYDMRRKFPHISFGILTGDCKDNPEADVLIMTTEILRNTLLNKKINKQQALAAEQALAQQASAQASAATQASLLPLLFEMDFDKELAAVVFDEVHYINDAERGSVWEQAILLLPPHIQLVMLSATIDRPEDFAGWIETEKASQLKEYNTATGADFPSKKMYLASTSTRVVPLTHYMWLTVNEGTIKKAAKTPYEKKLEALRRTPVLIASATGVFHEENYYKIKDVTDHLAKHKTYVKRQFVLEDLLTYLKDREMLPAICFVFSRKHVEQAAKEISFSLFEADSMLPVRVEEECRHILQSKLGNYKDYMELPEYTMIVGLLQKGIAIHHAGILPVLREMVELLFEKGFIRLLIATETFAVGLNMPTKTVIFAGLTKFNGSVMRLLYPHEYTQMAGRAGRRGIDTIGHVFHCVNLFELPTAVDYRHMITGPPQKLTSKFKISFNLALSMLDAKTDITAFMEQSMLSMDIRKEVKGYDNVQEKLAIVLKSKKEQLALCRTPLTALEDYQSLNASLGGLVNSARKKARLELNNLETAHKFILADLAKLEALYETETKERLLLYEKENTINYIKHTLEDLNKILVSDGFMTLTDITSKGRIAAQFQEVHPLAMADLYESSDSFINLTSAQLAGLFSAFCGGHQPAAQAHIPALGGHPHTPALGPVSHVLDYVRDRLAHYEKCENTAFLVTGANYDIAYDLVPYVIAWCESEDEATCKNIIGEITSVLGIFLGEFVKALLKINAIAQEFERVCESTQNIILLEKMRAIPKLTLKYIATSQSLYL